MDKLPKPRLNNAFRIMGGVCWLNASLVSHYVEAQSYGNSEMSYE
jgi:hypothetical protein